jgi:archaeal chaperonin
MDGKYVIGGGSIEIDLANGLRNYSSDVGGREQLAIQKFADALEAIPKTLVRKRRNGCNRHSSAIKKQAQGKGRQRLWSGYLQEQRWRHEQLGIYEPMKIKKQAIDSASEAAEIILRIDDMISSRGKSRGGPGGPPGMGGMGEMD